MAAPESEDSVIPLAIWGPSASGKTVLMAQLHLETHDGQGDWDVYPTHADSLKFIDQMQEYHLNNEFPPATSVGLTEQIAYEFCNRETGAKALLTLEDRGGKDFEHETLHNDARNRINTALGLVLMIDPTRDKRHIQSQLSHLLRLMHTDRRASQPQAANPKDQRPIAVCISKADCLIDSPADYRRACQAPDAFVRENDHWDITPLLERFCANYHFFPVSSVGVGLHHGVIEANTFYDESFNLRIKTKGKPFNLMIPFAWLIGQLATNS